MKQPNSISGEVGYVENVCDDPECNCKNDAFAKAFGGKWLAELNLLGPQGAPIAPPIILGPYETKEIAEEVLKRVEEVLKRVEEVLKRVEEEGAQLIANFGSKPFESNPHLH